MNPSSEENSWNVFKRGFAVNQIEYALVRDKLVSGEMYHRHLDRHKTHDAISALLYSDFGSSDIPESRPVHRDGLGNHFRRVKIGFGECSTWQSLHVLLDPSTHFCV